MDPNKSVELFLKEHDKWKKEINLLRSILLKTEADECIKWRMPTYTIKGKNVIGIGAFASHIALWFHQGSFLEDKQKALVNAQEGKTKGMRHMRFTSVLEMDKKIIKEYILEAIENQKQGKEIKVTRKKKFEVNSPYLSETLHKNKKLKAAFEALTPGRQRGHMEYIQEAKRESTKLSRLEKIKPLILAGKGVEAIWS